MNIKYANRVDQGFARIGDANLVDFSTGISDNLFGKPAFPAPPVEKVLFDEKLESFRTALAATVQGGTAATAGKNNIRRDLVGMLKELAAYVTFTSDDDLEVLLSSGFKAVSRTRTSEPLPAPSIRKLTFAGSGELKLTVEALRNARGYEVQVAEVESDSSIGAWVNHGFYTSSRNMVLVGLTGGKRYAARARALGGLTGMSGWSSPSIHMAS